MAGASASPEPVTDTRSPGVERLRRAALVAACVVLVAVFVPPLVTAGRRYEFVETVQFALAGLALPALLVVGWPLAGLSPGTAPGRGAWRARTLRLADRRRHHPGLARALVSVVVYAGVVILWRTPPLMDDLARHPWLVVVQVVSLVVPGVAVWLELVASPPMAPRIPRPWRAVLAAVTMWTIWVMAFIVGFSHVAWYQAFQHGGLMSPDADQQVSTGILWVASLAAFLPVIFGDLVAWLNNSDDPDAELCRLVRAERRSGAWAGPGASNRWR